MRNVVIAIIVSLAISGVASGQSSSARQLQFTDILTRMQDADLHAHLTAFNDLLTYASSESPHGTKQKSPSEILNAFIGRHPDKADQVKLTLIQLLTEENHSFIETKNPPDDSHANDDVGEYYAELVDTVSSLNDDRAIPALVGAMTTGGMAQRGVLKYGDKALTSVMEQLKSSDALVRASALGMATGILEEKKDANSHALVISLIQSSLKDPGAVVRSQAVQEIDCLDERKDFISRLQEIAKTDPLRLPGKALDGGDGNEFYPVRYDARQVLRHIKNNESCDQP
jgi:hypothetical protein